MIGLTLSLMLIMTLVLPAAACASKPDGAGSQNTDVEIVKKVGAKGLPLMGGVPSSGPKPHAATGVLGEPVTGDKYAILVGISDYPNEYGGGTVLEGGYDLCYAAYDAFTMAGILSEIYGFDDLIDPESKTFLFTGPPGGGELATKDNILDIIQYLKSDEVDLGPDDEVVFHFSGHGVKRNGGPSSQGGGQVGMAVWDGNSEEERFDFIWDYELKEAFTGFPTDRIVFVFDMCLAGGMVDVAAKGNVVCMATTQNGTAYEYGEDYYLASYDDVSGQYLLPDPKDEDLFPVEIANGLFTYALAGGMVPVPGPGVYPIAPADFYDHDGSPIPDVTIEEAFDFARYSLEEFNANSGGLFYQIPTIRDRFTGDLFFGYPEEG